MARSRHCNALAAEGRQPDLASVDATRATRLRPSAVATSSSSPSPGQAATARSTKPQVSDGFRAKAPADRQVPAHTRPTGAATDRSHDYGTWNVAALRPRNLTCATCDLPRSRDPSAVGADRAGGGRDSWLALRAGDRRGGWSLESPLSVGGAPEGKSHVWRVSDEGTAGVLKMCRSNTSTARKRFAAEAKNSILISNDPGVLPTIDLDPSQSPTWFVMKEARPLKQHLGPSPIFRDVVVAAEQVAATLARLESLPHPVAHRDIKPDNLFWLQGRAVVGDFGIATWQEVADLTHDGTKMGPANFLAPEMRSVHKGVDPFSADVYALAKTFYVLAFPSSGPYPPVGQHDAQKWQFSLSRAGGPSAEMLGPLIEAATSSDPFERPTMTEFAEELALWLTVVTLGEPRPVVPYRTGFHALREIAAELQKSTERVFRELQDAVHSLGEVYVDGSVTLDGEPDRVRYQDGQLATITLSQHGFEDGEEVDCGIVLAMSCGSDTRLVVGAYCIGAQALYIAEWQQRAISSDAPDAWVLRWSGDGWARVGFLAAAQVLRQLLAQARAHAPLGALDQRLALRRIW